MHDEMEHEMGKIIINNQLMLQFPPKGDVMRISRHLT